MLGYVLNPMVSMFRDLLDGSALPEKLHDALRRRREPALRTIRQEVDAAEDLLGLCRGLIRSEFRRIATARLQGNQLPAADNEPVVQQAEAAVAALRQTLQGGDLPLAADVGTAQDRLVTALTLNNALLRAGPNAALSLRLDTARESFIDAIGECEREVSYRVSALNARYSRVSFRNPQATTMADARFLAESYSLNAYNVDFSYLWPRLQVVLPDQGAQGTVDSYNDRLISARSRVDFAVLCTVLALTIPPVWLPLLAFRGSSILLFVAVWFVAPLVIAFFYQLAVESQFEFGEVIKSAIDKYRFNVLGELRLSLPPTLQSERALWGELRVVEQIASTTDLYYRHPATQTAQH